MLVVRPEYFYTDIMFRLKRTLLLLLFLTGARKAYAILSFIFIVFYYFLISIYTESSFSVAETFKKWAFKHLPRSPWVRTTVLADFGRDFSIF